jgi:hypothetical protein
MTSSDPTPGDQDEFVAIGFDGGTTYALTGENAGHWVEGSPTHVSVEDLRAEQSARQELQQRIDAALRSHTEREWRPLDGTYLGGTVCNHCRRTWPCAIVIALAPLSRLRPSTPTEEGKNDE